MQWRRFCWKAKTANQRQYGRAMSRKDAVRHSPSRPQQQGQLEVRRQHAWQHDAARQGWDLHVRFVHLLKLGPEHTRVVPCLLCCLFEVNTCYNGIKFKNLRLRILKLFLVLKGLIPPIISSIFLVMYLTWFKKMRI